MRPKIVFVDDDTDLQRSFYHQFGERYEVVTASDGLEAKQAIDRGLDLLVTDIRLPGIDGRELIAHARDREADLPVIAISGDQDVVTQPEALRAAGAFHFFPKPVSHEHLASAIERELWCKTSDFHYDDPFKLLAVGSDDIQPGSVSEVIYAQGFLDASQYFLDERIGAVLLNAELPDTPQITQEFRQTYPFSPIAAYGRGQGLDVATKLYFDHVVQHARESADMRENVDEILADMRQHRKQQVEEHVNMRPPVFWLLMGCRCSGKSSIRGGLESALPWLESVRSYTTRPRRRSEKNVDHYFVTKEVIEALDPERYIRYTYPRKENMTVSTPEYEYALDTHHMFHPLIQGRDVLVSVTNPDMVMPIRKAFHRARQRHDIYYARLGIIHVHADIGVLEARLHEREDQQYYRIDIKPDYDAFLQIRDPNRDIIAQNSQWFTYGAMTEDTVATLHGSIREVARKMYQRRFPAARSPF